MIAVTYRLELKEPALLTGLEGDPNSAVSLDFLPGSALRGAAISVLKGQNRNTDITPFLSGQIRFLNGYIVVSNQRSLPLPLSLRKEKDARDSDPIEDMVNMAPNVSLQTRQWRNVGGGFASVDEYGRGTIADIRRQLAVHTARDRRMGTATTANGTIYRYDSLAAYQTFEAVVLCSTSEQADQLAALVQDIDRVGGSTRAGYGSVCVTLSNVEEQHWKEHPFLPVDSGDLQVVMLLSDALLRDSSGQFNVSPELFADAIKPEISFKDAFLESTLVGAFNRTWGLPLPQALSCRRGSLMVLPADCLTAAEIDSLESEGIGERRAEGFGRVAVFGPVASWQISQESRKRDPEIVTLTAPEEIKAATLISRRVNEARQARKTLLLLSTMKAERRGLKSSQLARLREKILHQTLNVKPELACIEEFIGELTVKTASQWRKARVGETIDMLTWLGEYTTIRSEFRHDPPPVGGICHIEDEAERVKRQLRFVDSVLARMQKEQDAP